MKYRRKLRFGKRYIGYGARTPQLIDGGKDAPLSNRGYYLWAIAVAVIISASAILIAISR